MRVYLVRHGRTAMNIEGKTLGQADADLDSEGRRQLPLLELRFQGIKISRILSSDLKRAALTAEAVSRATGAPITFTPALRERSFGDLEGRNYGEVNHELLQMVKDQGVPLYETKPPGGESHHDVWNRTWPVIEPLFSSAETEDIAIVSHGGACRVMLSQLLKASLDTTYSFKFDNTSVTRVDRRPEGLFQLDTYNDTSHVRWPIPQAEAEPGFRGTN